MKFKKVSQNAPEHAEDCPRSYDASAAAFIRHPL